MFFSTSALVGVAEAGGLDRDQRLHLVGPCLRHLEAELPAWRVEEDDARTDLVDARGIRGDDRIVGGGPARHVLLGEIVVASPGTGCPASASLGRIGVVGTRALADAEALERVVLGQKHRLALEDVGVHAPSRRGRARQRRNCRRPSLFDE